MTWSDRDIRTAIIKGEIKILPFVESNVQPASLDVTLGDVFYRYNRVNWLTRLLRKTPILDPRLPVLMNRIESNQILLPPQGFLLGVTREKITLSSSVVARVEGKSSLGRIGLSVHTTAGFIDPGFSGYITMELSNQSPFPIRLYAGMYIGQIAFQYTLTDCEKPYKGRYINSGLPEPVVSKLHLRPGGAA